jgi:hypothetical protein
MERTDGRVPGAYEFVAAEYGWTSRYVETELTDELLLDYLDAAQERIEDRFETQVEAVRVGMVIAGNPKAMQRWSSRTRRFGKQQRGLTGAALDSAVMNVAAMFPGNVIHQVAA